MLFRNHGLLSLDILINMVHQDLKKAEHMISKNWYPKLINMISGKNALEDVSSELWPRFIKCASTIVSVQVSTVFIQKLVI